MSPFEGMKAYSGCSWFDFVGLAPTSPSPYTLEVVKRLFLIEL